MAEVLDATKVEAARQAGASEQDLSMIGELVARAQDFEAARQELMRMGAAVARTGDNALMQEYGDLVARADSIRSKIDAATQALDSAIAWARGTFGVSGMQTLAELGAWFLPIAAITAATAVLGYWISDYVKFSRRFNEQQRIARELQAAGADPVTAQRQAAESVAATSPGVFAGFGGLTAPVLLAALLIVGVLIYRNR